MCLLGGGGTRERKMWQKSVLLAAFLFSAHTLAQVRLFSKNFTHVYVAMFAL